MQGTEAHVVPQRRADITVRHMSRSQLNVRKLELTRILAILEEYSYDAVCQELGEVDYLIGKDDARWREQ